MSNTYKQQTSNTFKECINFKNILYDKNRPTSVIHKRQVTLLYLLEN